MTMRNLRSLFVGSLLANALLAQSAPFGGSVVSVISNLTPSEGIWFTDASGNATPILGLIAAGSAGNGVSACRLDPIDDRIWLGGTNNGGNTAGQVNWIRVTGATVTQFSQHANTGTASSIAAIEFDDNGNPIVAVATGIYRVERNTPGNATLIASIPTGSSNALTKDFAGNLYVGQATAGAVYVMTKNPDGSFQTPVQIGSVPTTTIVGVAFAPANGVDPDQIYVTTTGTAGNNIYKIPAIGGGAITVPTTNPSLNWCEYDRNRDYVVFAQTGPTDRLFVIDRAGAERSLSVLGNGVIGTPSAVDMNDRVVDAVAVAPMLRNGSATPFDLEFGVTVRPGSYAFIGILNPTVELLGFGVAGADGRVSFRLPNINLGYAIPPSALTFAAASLDPLTGTLNLGASLNWPVN
jgi:hypothetical protein